MYTWTELPSDVRFTRRDMSVKLPQRCDQSYQWLGIPWFAINMEDLPADTFVRNPKFTTRENILEGGGGYCLKLPPGSTVVGEKNDTQKL